jgi:hypothetical protein
MTYHLGDKMTRKRFRAEGYGKSSLLAKTFNHFKATYGASIPFGYGFGTHHSLRFGLRFLNYSDTEAVWYRRLDVIARRPHIKASNLKRLILGQRVDEVSSTDRSWTDFFDSVGPYYRYLAKRDEQYINWRYLRRPDRKYLLLSVKKRGELAGWSVFYREGNRIIWGDALFTPGDMPSVMHIFQHLLILPYSEGVEIIESWFPPRPAWWDAILKRLGFISEKEPNDLHLTGPVFSDSGSIDMLRKYFYYTMGDSDLF